MKNQWVKGFFASPFSLIFANKKKHREKPYRFFEIYGNNFSLKKMKFRALCSQSEKIGFIQRRFLVLKNGHL